MKTAKAKLLLWYYRRKMNKLIAKGLPLTDTRVIRASQKCDRYINLCLHDKR